MVVNSRRLSKYILSAPNLAKIAERADPAMREEFYMISMQYGKVLNENTYHIQDQSLPKIGEMRKILKQQQDRLFWFQTKFFHIQ